MEDNELAQVPGDGDEDRSLESLQIRWRLIVCVAAMATTALIGIRFSLRGGASEDGPSLIFGLGYAVAPIMMIALVGLADSAGRSIFRLFLAGLIWLDAALALGSFCVPLFAKQAGQGGGFWMLGLSYAAHALACGGVLKLLSLSEAHAEWDNPW